MAFRPCRLCKQPKPNKGWYCEPCDEARRLENIRAWHKCETPDLTKPWYECVECERITKDRQREVARRAAATRRKNNPHWARPVDAPGFWQRKAHAMVRSAIRQGILPRLTGEIACVDCGRSAQIYEHRDYSKPLLVEPVCDSCNKRRGTAVWPDASQFQFKRITDHK